MREKIQQLLTAEAIAIGVVGFAILALFDSKLRTQFGVSPLLILLAPLLFAAAALLIKQYLSQNAAMRDIVRQEVARALRDTRRQVMRQPTRADMHQTVKRLREQLERKIDTVANDSYKQIEALRVLDHLHPSLAPISGLEGWAVAPDLALELTYLVRDNKPGLVVELGSGTSTVIVASALKQHTQTGRILSLDHLQEYKAETDQLIAQAGYQAQAEVAYTPLTKYKIGKRTYSWYDISSLKLEKTSIDLVIVDGPPGSTNKHARYPALPLLLPYLSERAILVVDDYRRDDEHEFVEMWLKEAPDFELEVKHTQKKTAILRRQPKQNSGR